MADERADGAGDSGRDDRVNPVVSPPAADEVQRVDAEPLDAGSLGKGGGDSGRDFRYAHAEYRFGHRDSDSGGIHVHYASGSSDFAPLAKPPLLATWLCLLIAWFFLGSRVPFTVLLGLPLNIIALLLAMVSLSRGGVVTGVLVFLLGTAGSLIIYLVGLLRLLAH